MAILRHRDIEAVMPPEVRRRARKGGVPRGKVDWYAGRRYVSNVNVESSPEADSKGLPSQARDGRRRLRHKSGATNRQAPSILRAIANWPSRLSQLGRNGFIVK